MYNSIWENVMDKEKLMAKIKSTALGVQRDYNSYIEDGERSDYFDPYSGSSECVVEWVVDDWWGWKMAGAIAVTLFGAKPIDFDDLMDDDAVENWEVENAENLDFVEWFAKQEGIHEWVDAIADEYSDEIRKEMRLQDIPGSVGFNYTEGGYALIYHIDESELQANKEEEEDEG